MKKRTKKVLSFGVAALMAVSALPFSALSVTASVYKDQTANGGTPYDFVLKEQGTGVQEIQVSKDDVDAGNVTKTLDVFIDSDEWADDNYLNQVTLNWITTKGSTFADGGAVDNKIYYENVFNAQDKGAKHEVAMPDGSTVNTVYNGVFCLAPMFKSKKGWSYTDAQSNGVVRTIACDKIFGADLVANGDNKVKFTYEYYANVDDYLADKGADKATHKTKKTQECEVLTNEDGVPYITYSYINQGAEVAANYVEKTVVEELPCYTTTRFVKNTDGDDCVPDINNYYSWGFIAADSSDRTKFVTGDSMALRFTSFDVVIPKGTEEGTYYVQICSRDADKNLVPLRTAADFASVKAEQDAKRASGTLEDMSTAIHGKKATSTYSLPQDASKAIVKIVVGDGVGPAESSTTTSATTTTESQTTTTTSETPTEGGPVWEIGTVDCKPADEEVELDVALKNGIKTDGVVGAIQVPDVTRKILEMPEGYKMANCFVAGDAYSDLSKSVMNTKEYAENGRLGFAYSSETGKFDPAGDLLATLTMNIADADTVKAAAAEAGLEAKSDEKGTYYLFPVNWMEDGVDIGYSVTPEGTKEVEVKRFDYRDENNNDIHTSVKYVTGGFKVYTDAQVVEKDITWEIGTVDCKPSDEEVELNVTLKNGIKTDGVVGAMMVPDVTRKILEMPEGYKMANCFVAGDAYSDLSKAVMNTKEYAENGRLGFAYSSESGKFDPSGDLLATLTMNIADEATVKAAAAEAGLELKSDDKGSYYEFPVNWMEDGVDIGYSVTPEGTKEVEVKFRLS